MNSPSRLATSLLFASACFTPVPEALCSADSDCALPARCIEMKCRVPDGIGGGLAIGGGAVLGGGSATGGGSVTGGGTVAGGSATGGAGAGTGGAGGAGAGTGGAGAGTGGGDPCGCRTATGQCVPGDNQLQCGSGGGQCTRCQQGELCQRNLHTGPVWTRHLHRLLRADEHLRDAIHDDEHRVWLGRRSLCVVPSRSAVHQRPVRPRGGVRPPQLRWLLHSLREPMPGPQPAEQLHLRLRWRAVRPLPGRNDVRGRELRRGARGRRHDGLRSVDVPHRLLRVRSVPHRARHHQLHLRHQWADVYAVSGRHILSDGGVLGEHAA